MCRNRFYAPSFLPFLASLLFIFPVQPVQAQSDNSPNLPSLIDEIEGPFSGTWLLDNGQYNARWDNGAIAVITVASFTPQSVVLYRTDTPDSVSAGLTAVYTGQMSSTGDSVENGSVTWTWPGVPGYPVTRNWSASWEGVQIFLEDNNITGTTPSVVVGQRINLKTELSNNVACTLPMWSVEGLTVAGFEALPSFYDPTAGSALPTDFTKPSDTERFYWVRGGSFSVTASCMLGGQTLSTQVTFNVHMPNIPPVLTTMGTIGIVETRPGEESLQLGTSSSDIGIKFQTVPRSTGAYQWIQTVSIHAILLTPKGNHEITVSNELDTYYPYNGLKPGAQSSEKDYPGATLVASLFTKVSESFSARMYLMWNPQLPSNCVLPSTEAGTGTCTSISVPLGYVDWQWTGAAQYTSHKQWELVRGSTSKGARPFVHSTAFPHWLGRSISGCYPDCGRQHQTLFSSSDFFQVDSQ